MWGERVELFIWKLNSKPSDVNFSGWPNTDGLKLFSCYFVNSLSPKRGCNWILLTAAEITASHQTMTSSTSSLLATDSAMNWEKGCENFILFWAVIPVSRAIPGQQEQLTGPKDWKGSSWSLSRVKKVVVILCMFCSFLVCPLLAHRREKRPC